MHAATKRPIAIIGIGCRFPAGIGDPQSFWSVIAAGTDGIVDIPPDRWGADDYFHPDPDVPARMFVRRGGFLRGSIDSFDAGFFGMTPREACVLDPQQRLLLEVTWEAMEDAGVPPSSLCGARVGSYIGGFTFDAAVLQLAHDNRHLVSAATPTGVSMTMLSARLAYAFDWRGPTFTIDTACSSSLVAFHQACAALSLGECDLAVAGGVNVMVNPVTTILMSKGQFLSPDGRCKSFDHRANGYARAEGAGVLLLKPLEAAQRDGDRIYAVALGTAVNQDGRTPGITVPSGEAQQSLIRQACRVGGIEPHSVGYFEAHGTGTAVGDPIEAIAIGEVLAGSGRTHWIGSVKSNFGHAEAAAGVAGVIKASLCLERGLIPPNLHFERPNPSIPFDRLPLKVPTQMVPFEAYDGPRRASVNSFGFGGTNAHAILEQAPLAQGPTHQIEDRALSLLPFSARSAGALPELAAQYAALLKRADAPAYQQVCQASARGRDHHALRAFVVAEGHAEAVQKLVQLKLAPIRCEGKPSVAFVYTGMGPQWWGMGAELLCVPRFAEVVSACDRVLARFGVCVSDELRRPEDSSRLTETLYGQLANFVLQTGLTAMLRDWGIEPSAILGHSVGEVAAAYAAGVYSLEHALTISFHRANLQSRLAGRGAMAAVAASVETVNPYLIDGVSVAAVNSATTTTLAGDPEALTGVLAQLRDAGVSVKELRVEVAYHSHQMEAIRVPLLDALCDVRPQEPRVPLYSTVTGERMDGASMDADYWWRNVREPVRFADAFQSMQRLAPGIVLEVGPHPVLAPAIDEILSATSGKVTVVATQRRNAPQMRQLLEAVGAMYCAGFDVDWSRMYPGPRVHVDLPRYPWQRDVHWLESEASRCSRLGTRGMPFSGRTVAAPTPTREIELSSAQFPYLADHQIGKTVLFPGAGYVAAALAMFPDETPCVLENISFLRPLTLQPRTITALRCTYDPERSLVTLTSRGQGDDGTWTTHARIRHFRFSAPRNPDACGQALAEFTRELPETSAEAVYARIGRSSLNYGPAFRAVQRMWHSPSGEVFAEIKLDTVDAEGYRLHPVHLDAAFQAVVGSVNSLSSDASAPTFVPAHIGELRWFRAPAGRLWLRGRPRTGNRADQIECDLTLFTDDGSVVAEVIGLRARALADTKSESIPQVDLYYNPEWQESALEATAQSTDGTWAIVSAPGTWTELTRTLRERGASVLHVTADETGQEQIAGWVASASNRRGVIFLADACVEAPRFDGSASPVCHGAQALLRLVQTLRVSSARLFVITSGTQSVADDDITVDPFNGALWGLGRVVNAEHPELHCRLIDVMPGIQRQPAAMDELIGELTHEEEDDVALRQPGKRYVRRLNRVVPRSSAHHVAARADATSIRVCAGDSGLEGLTYIASQRRAPGPTEIEIEIAYVGLNFKDVLKVTGLLAREAMEGSYSQETLGLECSGTIVRVGSEVSYFKVGDEVFAHSRDLFGSHATLDAQRVVKKPATLSLQQAASLLPVVTAYLSLVHLARVQKGERMLVHSAAGGVGLAAIRIGKWLGAEVYATAGSEARRNFLLQEGVALVADSRGATFADDVRDRTGGTGVDVVLNSQPGEIQHKSLGLLRPFGRFIELGKGDIAADNALSLAPFQHSLSFHALDYDQMMRLAPERVLRCMQEVAGLYDEGAFAPLPIREVRAAQVSEAFRSMTRSDHAGKIVVKMASEVVAVPARSIQDSPIKPEGVYLITGGLGGLGLTVARWLADRGARQLVLVGRRGVTSEDTERTIAELIERGVNVRIEKVDVGQREQVASLLARTRETMASIRGIVHAAADFDDAVLSVTNPERLVSATRPKADGAWYLHLETQCDELDFFVLFSSVAAQIGAAAAGAYATANEFLNALARYRHALKLPATSIGWGMVGEVGVTVSRNGLVGNVLRRNGHVPLSPARLLAELETLVRTKPVEVSVANIEWQRWARANPQLAALPRYAELAPSDSSSDDGPTALPIRLRGLGREARMTLLAELVVPILERTTGLQAQQLNEQQAVDIDSLAAVELKILLQNAFAINVPSVQLQRNLTAKGLAELLADALEGASGDGAADDIVMHEFVSSDGLTIYGHLSVPAGPGPYPAVVVCSSGTGGALDEQGRYAHIGEHGPLMNAGFAVFSVDLRGSLGHGDEYTALADMGGRDIDDVAAAAHYLASLPEIDASMISILGTSRGAYSAILASQRYPQLWRRAVLIMGLYDPSHLVVSERDRPGASMPAAAGVGWRELDTHFSDPSRRPFACLGQVKAPLLIVHGDADDLIPLSQAIELHEHAKRQGLPARLVVAPGMPHDIDYATENWKQLWPDIIQFLAG
jgi:epothilone polyketide synthase D